MTIGDWARDMLARQLERYTYRSPGLQRLADALRLATADNRAALCAEAVQEIRECWREDQRGIP